MFALLKLQVTRCQLSGEVLLLHMFPSQTSRRLCGRSGACGGLGWRRQIDLLHMGQTLRISNHFSRHLRKADRWETYYLIFHFKGRQSTKNYTDLSRWKLWITRKRSSNSLINSCKTGLSRQTYRICTQCRRYWWYRWSQSERQANQSKSTVNV